MYFKPRFPLADGSLVSGGHGTAHQPTGRSPLKSCPSSGAETAEPSRDNEIKEKKKKDKRKQTEDLAPPTKKRRSAFLLRSKTKKFI